MQLIYFYLKNPQDANYLLETIYDPSRNIFLYFNLRIHMPDMNHLGLGSRIKVTLTICKTTTDLQKPDRIRVGTYFRFLISIYKCQVGPGSRFTFILKTHKTPTDFQTPYRIRVETYSYIIISGSICQIGTRECWVADLDSRQQFASQKLTYRTRRGSGQKHILIL